MCKKVVLRTPENSAFCSGIQKHRQDSKEFCQEKCNRLIHKHLPTTHKEKILHMTSPIIIPNQIDYGSLHVSEYSFYSVSKNRLGLIAACRPKELLMPNSALTMSREPLDHSRQERQITHYKQ